MKYKDAIIPAWISEELVDILNLSFLMSVDDRFFGESNIDHKELENRIIRVQQNLFRRVVDC